MAKIFNKEFVNKNKVSLLLAVVLVAFYVVENINGRFWLNDFKVYYSAASQMINGGIIYNKLFSLGSGYYKYSPFAAVFFIPFAFLKYSIASSIYFFIVASLIIYVLNVSLRLITMNFGEDDSRNNNSQIIILYAFLASVVHLQRELHLGNVNILLLAILLLSIKGIMENKTILPAMLLGIAILFKPHFLILFPLLFLRKKYKVMLISSASIIIGLLIPAIYLGFGKNIELHTQWIETMKTHNAGIINAEQTIYFLLNHYLLRFFVEDSRIVFLIVGMILLTSFILLFLKQKKNNQESSNKNFLANAFFLLALIPSITLTDTEHFIFSLPLIMYLIYYIGTNKVKPLFLILFWIGILCYCGNIHDLLGSKLSYWVLMNGFLGMGNLILISLFIYSQTKNNFATEINQ